MINEPKNVVMLESLTSHALAADAPAIAVAQVPSIPESRVTNLLADIAALTLATQQNNTEIYWAKNFATGGDGSSGTPYTGWKDALPIGPHVCIAFGSKFFDVGTGWTFNQDGYDDLKILGFGATLIYTGATNLATPMVSFSGNINQLGTEGIEFQGFRLDGNGKVTGDMILWRSMHNSLIRNVVCLRGTGTALRIEGCTVVQVNGFRCTRFDHAGQVNPFAHGIIGNLIASTGNALSTALLSAINVAGTQQEAVMIDGAFNFYFQGAAEATVTGYGLTIGATSICQNVRLAEFDCETCGGLHPTTNGHLGVHVVRCGKTLIENSHNFDSSLIIESTAGVVECLASQFFNVFHDTAMPFMQFACEGMDVANGNVFGAGYLRTNFGNTAAGVALIQDFIVGRGLQGARHDTASYGGMLWYAQGIPNALTRFALFQDGNGDTQVGGKTLQVNAGGVATANVTSTSWTLNVALTLATLNGATVNTGTANKIFATPSGGSGAPTLRSLVAGDIPALPESGVTNLTTDLAGKVGTGRQILTTIPMTGGGDLSADRTIAISDFVGSGASHARGAVPDPGASAGTTKFLREDASWAVPPGGGGGLADAYATITDGTTPATASGSTTFKLRSANSVLTIATANNDVTHGDNALYTIVVSAIDHNSLANLSTGDVHGMYLNVNGRSGGQVAYGGTGASETLNIQSTSHVTKGSLLIGPITITSAGLMSGAADPVSAQDVVTKKYADALAAGLQVKGSVQAATTAALPANTYANGTAGVGATLTGTANGALAAIDGVTLGLNDLFLAKNQASAFQNGIYKLTQVGTGGTPYIATRATNNDETTEIAGAYVMVLGGTVNIDQGWIVNSAGPYTIGTTAITWTQFTGVADITFTAPLSKSGNTVSIPTAAAGVDGYLAGTDWTTFNNKVGTARTISTTAPITGGGDLSANRTFAIAAATTSVDGYLTSTDWNTFNGKVATSRSISTTAPLTGGGDLSANRTLAITLADATHDGYLSQTDWATFNGILAERSVTFDGGGAVLTAGTKVRLRIPYAGTIQRVTMLADQSGSAVVDIKKVAYGSYTGAGSGTSIVASAPPTITTAVKSQDATMTGWTLTVAANDVLEFSITSATTIQQLEVSLEIKRT